MCYSYLSASCGIASLIERCVGFVGDRGGWAAMSRRVDVMAFLFSCVLGSRVGGSRRALKEKLNSQT